MKENENVYFRARKEAAKYNERLSSREGAAELLGVSASTLADYELGNTKVVPVDKVVLMADLYNCPELKAMQGGVFGKCGTGPPAYIQHCFPLGGEAMPAALRRQAGLCVPMRRADRPDQRQRHQTQDFMLF